SKIRRQFLKSELDPFGFVESYLQLNSRRPKPQLDCIDSLGHKFLFGGTLTSSDRLPSLIRVRSATRGVFRTSIDVWRSCPTFHSTTQRLNFPQPLNVSTSFSRLNISTPQRLNFFFAPQHLNFRPWVNFRW